MTYDAARQQVVLFGGSVGTPTPLGDTWIWDGAAWTQKFPVHSPGLRSQFRMPYDAARAQVVLFGGWNGSSLVNETWVWDGVDWTQKFPVSSPSPRQDFAIAYDANLQRVVLFSGNQFGCPPLDNLTWTWDGTNWTQESPAASPPGRGGAAAAYDSARGQVVLFGGNDCSQVFTDTWVWGIGFLSFPLLNKTATTAAINTVFDHSMEQPYCPDYVVTAYTGEEGNAEFGISKFFVHFPSCDDLPLYGFKQDEEGTPFRINGHYVGGTDDNGQCCFLFYDGHPGYDYRTTDQRSDGTLCPEEDQRCNPSGRTPVLAVAAGEVDRVCPDDTGCRYEGPGEVRINHGNGYYTIYLHLSSIEVDEHQQVAAGQMIGISGDTGSRGHPIFTLRCARVEMADLVATRQTVSRLTLMGGKDKDRTHISEL